MIEAPPPSAETAEPLDDEAWEKALLRELAEASVEYCRYLQGRMLYAVKAQDDAMLVALAGAHARQARAARMSIAQHARLRHRREDLQRREEARQREEAAAKAAAPEAQRAVSAEQTKKVRRRLWSLYGKDKVREVALKAIETERDGADRERLTAELDAWLEDEARVEAFGDLSIGRAIVTVCDALGLNPDWSLWKHQTWAIETNLPGVPRPGARRNGVQAQGP